ncbi:8323_t:CDS:2 [Funneliformis mosseae]|uniref:8323_t:CDS:1 n=1 Tax=Funneliformis mosseae TaxID=27381 RepID=A0A9N9BL22_FUNMO|nr:8323_t:CDS:2 [Funneliformis mosseae]
MDKTEASTFNNKNIPDEDEEELTMNIVNKPTQHTPKNILMNNKLPPVANSPKIVKNTNFVNTGI